MIARIVSISSLTLSLSLSLVSSALAQHQTFSGPQVYCAISGSPCEEADAGDIDECVNTPFCSNARPLNVDLADIMGPSSSTYDDYPEMAVISNDFSSGKPIVSVFRNLGNTVSYPDNQFELHATYEVALPSGVSALGYDIQFADMDRPPDGYLDIVVSLQADTDRVAILYNDGDGDFANISQSLLSLSTFDVNGLHAADLDGDGDTDIAVAGAMEVTRVGAMPKYPCVEVLLSASGQTDGFHHEIVLMDALVDPNLPTPLGIGTEIASTVLCPPQVSGRLDLVMAMDRRDSEDQKVALIRNYGDEDLDGFVDWGTPVLINGVNSKGLAVGKLQAGSSKKDIALTNEGSHKVVTITQNSCTDYAEPTEFALGAGEQPFGVDIGHLTPDTKQDIIVACQHGTGDYGSDNGYSHGVLALLKRTGDNTYHSTRQMIRVEKKLCCPKPCFVRIVDVNDDGVTDIVSSNNDDDTLSVLFGPTPE